MHSRITYTCKKCQWSESVTAMWADLKPKRCGNKACKTFFLKEPDMLLTEMPVVQTAPVVPVEDTKPTKNKKSSREDANV